MKRYIAVYRHEDTSVSFVTILIDASSQQNAVNTFKKHLIGRYDICNFHYDAMRVRPLDILTIIKEN